MNYIFPEFDFCIKTQQLGALTSVISWFVIYFLLTLYFYLFNFIDESLEECILQAEEHIPAEQNVELQDEQPNLENLPMENEYVPG